jgi:hypothetical protein
MYTLLTALSLALVGQAEAVDKDDAEFAKAQQKKWNELYRSEAAAYAISLDGVDQELRLLSQPLYRYESTLPEVVDGALFTFVTGTDPELMLVIEARRAFPGGAWERAARTSLRRSFCGGCSPGGAGVAGRGRCVVFFGWRAEHFRE